MKQVLKYVDLPWAVVGVCESESFTINQLVHDDSVEQAVERYVIGYMAFWQIAFVEKERLVPCDDKTLRASARLKIARYIAEHPPVECLPRFYIVLLQQPCAPLETDGTTRVYQM
jgi:hypothetical protein